MVKVTLTHRTNGTVVEISGFNYVEIEPDFGGQSLVGYTDATSGGREIIAQLVDSTFGWQLGARNGGGTADRPGYDVKIEAA